MSRIVSSLVFSMALALLSLSARAIDLAESPIFLASKNDLEAVVAPTTDEHQALVKISGLNHPIDGVVFLATVEERGNDGRAYRAEVDGRMRSLIVYAPSYWATSEYSTYVPGLTEAIGLMPDKSRAEEIDLKQLVAEYEQQKSKGIQAEVARFDRKKATHRQQEALKDIDESASQVCGSRITTRVDWTALSDEQLNALSISGYCGQVASEMEYRCSQDDDFQQTVAAITVVDCAFSDELSISRDNDTLVFTTRKDADNQRAKISEFLDSL